MENKTTTPTSMSASVINNYEEADLESFAFLDPESLDGYITPPLLSTSTSTVPQQVQILGETVPVEEEGSEVETVPERKGEQEQDLQSTSKATITSAKVSESKADVVPEVTNLSSHSVGTDKNKDVGAVSLELKRVTEENVLLKRELESLKAKLKETESNGKDELDKIKKEMGESVAKLEKSSLKVSNLKKENKSLRSQIEVIKLRMTELETHLDATCAELTARKKDDDKFVRKEKVEVQLRFKDDQLEQTKKQLKELDELYQDEQSQILELKEKLRIAESQPLSSRADEQLFSFDIADILSLQQEVADSKALADGQSKEVEKLQTELERQRKMLVETDKERTFLAQITMLLGGLLAISLLWMSRSSNSQE